jgi:penicillin-binding protein 1A
MMTSVVNEGTGTAAKFTESEMPLAGKTGTTTDSKDLTFVGYTPYYVASIWYGYDRYDSTVSNMNNLNQTTHLKVWKKVMEQVNEGLEVKDFPMPDDVVKATVCKYTGYLASSSCPAVTDYFVKNDKVESYCSGRHSGRENFFGTSKNSSSAYFSSGSSSSSSSSRRRNSGSSSSSSSYSSSSESSSSSNNSSEANETAQNDTDSSGGEESATE